MTATLAKPTPAQLAWHDTEMGMFLHWSPGTYEDTGSGHDTLTIPPAAIHPHLLDTEQWVDVAESMGAKYIVIVAKHVGGFCLWQTQTTDYGIAATPWRDGKGDVVGDLAESCRRRGMPLGVYLSPQDRHFGANVGGVCTTPERQMEYNAFYRRQLAELLTGYGEMFEVWFDGSNCVDVGDLLAEHAPNAMVFQSRFATIRWVGNEEGIATYPAWNTVGEADARSNPTNRHGTPDGEVWMPLECDARIRAAWFWSTANEKTLKSVDELMAMYYRSVGNGAVLLLNHAPDTTGRIPEADAVRAAEFGREIRRRFGTPLAETRGAGDTLELPLEAPQVVDHVILMEEIAEGERIRHYLVEDRDASGWHTLCRGTAVGHKRIERFAPVEVSGLRLRCLKSAGTPLLREFAAYFTGVPFVESREPVALASYKVGEWGEEIYYGVGWGRSVEVTYDLTAAVDDAGQYELRFVQTAGAHGFLVESVSVAVNGTAYPEWVSATNNPAVFHLSFPGVERNVRLTARLRGDGGADCSGEILLTRHRAA